MKTFEFTSAQNVKVEYELASVPMRAAAYLLDVIAFVIYCIVLVNVTGIGPTSQGGELLLWFLIIKIPLIFYNPMIEYFTQGQSLGKYILGIRVVTIHGERPGLREVFTRWIFKGDFIWISVDFMAAPFTLLLYFSFGLIGALFAFTSFKNQRVGDLMAGTYIIKNKSTVKYHLRDIMLIRNIDNHEPTYPQVTRFTDEDMLLIKTTISRVQSYPSKKNKDFAVQLADETARLLGLPEIPPKRFEFLKTVLHDYVVLTR